MTQPLLLRDRNPAYFPAGMSYAYDGKLYPRHPTLPDISTQEVLGTDVGSAHGRRMIAVAPTDEAIRRMAKQGITSSDDPRITKHLHEELERREKKDRSESTRARLAIAQKLKEGKLQDLWILKPYGYMDPVCSVFEPIDGPSLQYRQAGNRYSTRKEFRMKELLFFKKLTES